MRGRLTMLAALALVGGVLTVPNATAQDQPPTDPGELRVEAGVAPGAGVGDPRPGEAFADPKIFELQSTANQVQRELGTLAGRITDARAQLEKASAQVRRARAERKAAERLVASQQAQVDQFSRSVFTAMGRPDEIRLLMTVASPEDLLAGTSMVNHLRARQDTELSAATTRHRKAVSAERKAAGIERAAADRKAELDRRNGDATNRADAVSSELRGPIDEANSAVIAQQQAQKERNAKTAANWKAYVDRLDDAGVVVPRAVSLRNPARLPAGLKPLLGKGGKPQPGVAQVSVAGQRVLVLPRETVDAVTEAVDALGKPYVPNKHGDGPTSYSCDGLVKSVFTGAGLRLPGGAAQQLATGRRVPRSDAQPGDLVFVGPAAYGVQHVGMVLDERTMLAADGRLASVVVTDLPGDDTILGVTRPALGKAAAREVPQQRKGELTWRCGGVELPRTAAATRRGEAAGAWGGYPNGLIPSSVLCSIGIGGHALRCDAAQTFLLMSRAFAERFGQGLCVTDSYRTFSAQVDLYRRKPALAAVPGTSNHGWALALDMCGGVQSFGTAQYAWLAGNGPAFGWVNPVWARPGGGREEPWHWEFVGG